MPTDRRRLAVPNARGASRGTGQLWAAHGAWKPEPKPARAGQGHMEGTLGLMGLSLPVFWLPVASCQLSVVS